MRLSLEPATDTVLDITNSYMLHTNLAVYL